VVVRLANDAVIDVRDVSRAYGAVLALDRLSLSVRPGGFTPLLS
jgi:ABC-type sugar transport system ATPase subunit